MSFEINLSYSQSVQYLYNINIRGKVGWLGVVVYIDGQQQTDSRTLTGYTNHHSNNYFDEVWLRKGKHIITLKYKSNYSLTEVAIIRIAIAPINI